MNQLILTIAAVALLVFHPPVRCSFELEFPKSVPPLIGTATATGEVVGADAPDEWEIKLTVPKARWELVGKIVPKSEWPRLEVVVEKTQHTLSFGGNGALSESRVLDLEGKDVAPAEVLKRLKSETPVLVSVSGDMPEPYYLQLTKPGTLVIVLGPREYAPVPALLPAAKGSTDQQVGPRKGK